MVVTRPGVGVIQYDPDRMSMTWDATAASIFDDDGSGDPMSLWYERTHPDDRDRLHEMFRDVHPSVGTECTYRVVVPSGTTRYVLTRNMGASTDDNGVQTMTGIVFEVGPSLGRDARLAESLDLVSDGFVTLDAGLHVAYVNVGAERMLGIQRTETIGRKVAELQPHAEPILRSLCDSVLANRVSESVRIGSPLEDGVILELCGTPANGGVVINIRDVSAEERAAARVDDAFERLLHDARHDALTGILSRSAITQELDALATGQGPVALMFIDVDDFKAINDSHGHLAGDAVLVETASRLDREMEQRSLIGRMGGDEFVVVLPGCSQEKAGALAVGLLRSLAMPVHWRHRSMSTTVSIGLASSDGARSLDDLLYRADVALYDAKRRGKNCTAWFDPSTAAEQIDVAAIALELSSDVPAAPRRLGVGVEPLRGLDKKGGRQFVATPNWLREDGSVVAITENLGNVVPVESRTRYLSNSLDALQGEIDRWRLPTDLFWLRVPSGLLCEEVLPQSLSARLVRRMLDMGCGVSVDAAAAMDHSTAPNRIDDLAAAGLPVALHDFGSRGVITTAITGVSAVFLAGDLVVDIRSDAAVKRLTTAVRIGHAVADVVFATGVDTDERRDCVGRLGCAAVVGELR